MLLNMKRIYESLFRTHLDENRQMAFVCGPRQVGKTTSAKALMSEACYRNWDDTDTKRTILKGTAALAIDLGLDRITETPPVIVLDEFHKFANWKSFLKGFFDVYAEKCRIIVTGSAMLNTYRRGGDSLMGRYFVYNMHPLSVGELSNTRPADGEIQLPSGSAKDSVAALLDFGGFPEPFIKQNKRFWNRWNDARMEQLIREDVRDLAKVNEISLMQSLAIMIAGQCGQELNYSRLAVALGISVDTVIRWVRILESMYYCFTVRPWYRNVSKSLRKQPKVFLWDWSGLADAGARNENFVACHLLKSVNFWADSGLGKYELRYLRDKTGREVDFVVIRNGEPWFLVEVKSSVKREMNPNLAYFQNATKAKNAFQVCFDMDYVERDCFEESAPVKVPISTLMSQLV